MGETAKGNVGSWGEELAQKTLIRKGYTILETNWRFSHKEIDIIAEDDNNLVIVEVKTRTTTFTRPCDAVTKKKQNFLLLAANQYVVQHNIEKNVRFDIISIVSANGIITIEHLENAFYPSVKG